MTSTRDSDLTRKQRREQARAQRKAIEAQKLARAAKRKRLAQIGAVSAVVIAIILALVITGGGSGQKTSGVQSAKTNETVAAVSSLLSGIPQSGNVLGNPKAPLTLQYFGDLECPFCREFTIGALPTVIQKYVRTGKLKIEYRSVETATREPDVFNSQQVAALAAGKQKLMWDYVELFYHEQGEEDSGYVTEKYLQELAQQVPGLNLSRWRADRSDQEFTNQLLEDGRARTQYGLEGTPSFLLGKTGGTMTLLKLTSSSDPSQLESAINRRLNG